MLSMLVIERCYFGIDTFKHNATNLLNYQFLAHNHDNSCYIAHASELEQDLKLAPRQDYTHSMNMCISEPGGLANSLGFCT